MSFSKFNIDKLAEDAEDDYAVEITTSNSKLGILLSEEEAEGIAHAILQATEDGVDTLESGHITQYLEDS